MAVPRSQRLKVVLDLAVREEDEVRQRLQDAQAQVQRQEQRRDELRAYQADYLQQLSGQRETGARALQSLHHYVSQLAEALRAQEQRIALARLQADKVRDEWRLAHEKRRGMERFIEECQRQERVEADRREQKLFDELASRRRR